MKKVLVLLLGYLALGCTTITEKGNTSIKKRQFVKEINQVEVMILERSVFKKEMVSSGKLYALKKSNLMFKVNGEIEKLCVKNGDYIKAGAPIAILNKFEQEQRYNQAQLNLDKATIDLMDALLSMGYNLEDSLSIPKDFMKIAKSRSGYSSAKNELETASYELKSTILKAPFAGKIANLKTNEHEYTSGEVFCLLIDDSVFEVHFNVLETELSNIRLKKTVEVNPFSSEKTYSGYISEINPYVNENGLISVKAVLKNTGDLIEGMNVKVMIENNVLDQLVVPKSAVLQRDNQEVLFKYKNGTARWIYVQKYKENSTTYAVVAHPKKGGNLDVGDTIIVSGNLNLAHESKVEIIKN